MVERGRGPASAGPRRSHGLDVLDQALPVGGGDGPSAAAHVELLEDVLDVQQRAQARQQLVGRERLDEVVVAADQEAGDAVERLDALAGEEQDRQVGSRFLELRQTS